METRGARAPRLRNGFEPTNRARFAAHVARLRKVDDSRRSRWAAALGAFEVLRMNYARPDGRLPDSDTYLAGELGISRNTWADYAGLLEKAGLLQRVGYFTNRESNQEAGWRIPVFDDLAGREEPAQTLSSRSRKECAVARSVAQIPAQSLRDLDAPEQGERRARTVRTRDQSARATTTDKLDAVAKALTAEGHSTDRVELTIRRLEEYERSGKRPDRTWLALGQGIARQLTDDELADHREETETERRRTEEREAIDGCPRCDDAGRIEVGEDIDWHVEWCDHGRGSPTTGVDDGPTDDATDPATENAVELLRDELGAEVVCGFCFERPATTDLGGSFGPACDRCARAWRPEAERARAGRSPVEVGSKAQVRGTSSDGLSGGPAASEGPP